MFSWHRRSSPWSSSPGSSRKRTDGERHYVVFKGTLQPQKSVLILFHAPLIHLDSLVWVARFWSDRLLTSAFYLLEWKWWDRWWKHWKRSENRSGRTLRSLRPHSNLVRAPVATGWHQCEWKCVLSYKNEHPLPWRPQLKPKCVANCSILVTQVSWSIEVNYKWIKRPRNRHYPLCFHSALLSVKGSAPLWLCIGRAMLPPVD